METAGPNHVGGRVKVTGRGVGTLLFYGKTQFQNGDWCGVWLDEARGKNDGSVNGTRYFKCPSNHGVFVSPANVVPVFEAKKAPRRQGSVRTPKASSQRQASTPTSRTGSAVRKDATAAAKEGTKEGAGKDLAASGTKEVRSDVLHCDGRCLDTLWVGSLAATGNRRSRPLTFPPRAACGHPPTPGPDTVALRRLAKGHQTRRQVQDCLPKGQPQGQRWRRPRADSVIPPHRPLRHTRCRSRQGEAQWQAQHAAGKTEGHAHSCCPATEGSDGLEEGRRQREA